MVQETNTVTGEAVAETPEVANTPPAEPQAPAAVAEEPEIASETVDATPPVEPEAVPASPIEDHAHHEVVSGVIQAVEGGETVVIELQGKLHGVIPASVFEKVPRVGVRLEFVVEHGATDDKGRVKLHLAEQADKLTWKNLEVGSLVDAMVTGMNIGGLELKIAGSKIRAFMPASQIDINPVEDLTPYLGHKIQVKVLSLDKKKRRVVLSRRAILIKEHRKQRMKEIKPGDEMTGKVRKIEEFGVFVDLEPGLDGLVRFDDLSWKHFDKPEEVVQIGQEVKVKVLHLERGRLTLGIRQAQPDPWKEVETKYPLGQKVKVKVVETLEFLAIVELEPGVEGSIHISQLSERRVENVEKAVRVGQLVDAKVIEHDGRKRRVQLSIRALTAPNEGVRAPQASRDEIKKYVKRADKAHAMESLMAKFGEGSGLKGGIG